MHLKCLLTLGLVALLLFVPQPVVAELPDEARKLLEDYEKDAQAIQKKADEAIGVRKEKLIKALKEVQAALCRAAKLDEALAIRTRIRELRGIFINVRPDPGVLAAYRAELGKPLYFLVTGRSDGIIWGSELYTDDSALATAAVHSGVLKEGQKGLVMVTMVKHVGIYLGVTRNGVTSQGFGPYPGSSYRVEAIPKD